MNEFLLSILSVVGIDPNTEVITDTGTRTALEVLESAVLGALDEIEDNLAENK